MKTTKTACLILASLFFGLSSTNVQAQNTDPSGTVYHHNDYNKENPTADQDIKMVEDYTNALLVSGDLEKVKSLLADNYKGYGPGPNDSVTAEQVITTWRENYKTHTNRKANFVEHTWYVTEGEYKGNWVAMWGDYNCTINGKSIKIPFQLTAHVTNGKIDSSIVYYDNLSSSLSLGYTLTPPKEN